MRRFTMCSSVVMMTLLGAIVVAQAPAKIATFADHAALMQSNAQANGALNNSLASGAFAGARTAAATLRTNATTLRTFWTEKNNAEALKIVNDGLSGLDALDKLLAAPAPDPVAAKAAANKVGGTCGACHTQFRDGSAQAGFRFRDSSILAAIVIVSKTPVAAIFPSISSLNPPKDLTTGPTKVGNLSVLGNAVFELKNSAKAPLSSLLVGVDLGAPARGVQYACSTLTGQALPTCKSSIVGTTVYFLFTGGEIAPEATFRLGFAQADDGTPWPGDRPVTLTPGGQIPAR